MELVDDYQRAVIQLFCISFREERYMSDYWLAEMDETIVKEYLRVITSSPGTPEGNAQEIARRLVDGVENFDEDVFREARSNMDTLPQFPGETIHQIAHQIIDRLARWMARILVIDISDVVDIINGYVFDIVEEMVFAP